MNNAKSILTGLVLTVISVLFAPKNGNSQVYGLYYDSATTVCLTSADTTIFGNIRWSEYSSGYSPGDYFDITIDWGDGSPVEYYSNNTIFLGMGPDSIQSIPVQHTYASIGHFPITVVATDNYSNSISTVDSFFIHHNCGWLSGYIRLDDGDGIYEMSDPIAPNVPMIITTGSGIYNIQSQLFVGYILGGLDITSGACNIEIDPTWLAGTGTNIVMPVSGNYTLPSPPIAYTSNDFLLDCSGTSSTDAFISGHGSFLAPAGLGYVHINWGNSICPSLTTDLDISIDFDPLVTPYYTNVPSYTISGNTLTAHFTSIGNYFSIYNDFVIYFNMSPSLPVNTPLNFTFNINTTTFPDYFTTNNSQPLTCYTQNSWDPNQKTTNLTQVIDVNLAEEIHYTIDFQNLGNYDAINIHVVDTIDPQFDLSTFQLEALSHQGSYVIDPVNRVINFSFPNIWLAPQSVSDSLSKGFIRYKVKENAGLTNGSDLKNTAYIYFDGNPAVITNTTSNVNAYLGLENNDHSPITIYPQPANDKIYISGIDLNEINDLVITDNHGQVIQTINAAKMSEGILISTLPSGLYFISIKTKEKTIQQKLIVYH